jgi:cell wall assembly regulator SMI1
MKEIWNRIESWLAVNAPELLKDLRPGATDEQIQEAEEFLSVKFSEDFKESSRIHDGQFNNVRSGLLYHWDFLSLKGIMSEWETWKELLDSGEFVDIMSEPDKFIKNDWWNPKWIPLTHDLSGNHHCLDYRS